MHPDLASLLTLQSEDAVVDGLEQRLAALDPRLADLDRQRTVAEEALHRAESAAEADEKKRRELEGRFSDHKQKQERNLANLEVVRRLREATAAMAQVEQARKILAEEESELQALTRRVSEDHSTIGDAKTAIDALDDSTRAEREAIEQERVAVQAELTKARGLRDQAAQHVPRATLAKYDRIRRRRGAHAVFPLHAGSCGNCDTAIPLQRRTVMLATGAIEVCEVCGVLLYAEAPVPAS